MPGQVSPCQGQAAIDHTVGNTFSLPVENVLGQVEVLQSLGHVPNRQVAAMHVFPTQLGVNGGDLLVVAQLFVESQCLLQVAHRSLGLDAKLVESVPKLLGNRSPLLEMAA
jgi:hypothetical protein